MVNDEVGDLIDHLVERSAVRLTTDDGLPLIGLSEADQVVDPTSAMDGIPQDWDPFVRADQTSETVTGGAPARRYVRSVHISSGQLLGETPFCCAVIALSGGHG